MSESINRAQFLRGDLHGERLAVRPPWAKPEAQFMERCVRCDDCIRRCSQQILRRGAGGYPQVDFTFGPCTFCGDCVRACRHHALTFDADLERPPWSLSVVFRDDCLSRQGVTCRSCGEHCEESALRFRLQTRGRALPSVDPERCSGCGACYSACPTGSIRIRPCALTRAA